MRILETNLRKGIVKVVPESMDDFWHLYNVIYKNDEVYAHTTREVKPDDKYGRPGRGERIPVFLGIRVQNVDWDRLLGRLRVHGTICQAPETVPMGTHHTLKVTLGTAVAIVKKNWAQHHLERLKRAGKTSEKPIIIVSMDDEGYVIATTAQYGVEQRVEERIRLPGKLETEKRGAATSDYFRKTLENLRLIWTAARHPIVIIGVGFVKNDFAKYVRNEAADIGGSVIDVKSVNNSGIVGINEALRSGILSKAMKQLRVVEETEAVEEIFRRLGKEEPTVAYGLKSVEEACKLGAVERLVLADSELRESSDEKRLLFEQAMSCVEKKGGNVMTISTEHEAGVKLISLGGIAAILRFPVLQRGQ